MAVPWLPWAPASGGAGQWDTPAAGNGRVGGERGGGIYSLLLPSCFSPTSLWFSKWPDSLRPQAMLGPSSQPSSLWTQ